ncbi:M20/M25/M40 family metallo-hydrolase [Wansuia hejianensis]|uniref:M20/M25/M40 family metallo-hydrolase n=1 Tax=Wansuia hejianensis TaxID=2763667 RepID=A0A926IMR8_9FIRM|nr:M20/M25/M40 family metallo-hydrolase [Wansuia hejianensis]MBC8591479.1 M20/M25/M40 family metallo-hydrolase [Wansuia hejianensis]
MINEKRVLDRFLEYIQIDSPTKDERKFADFLMKEMEKIGIEVYMDNAGEKVGSNSGNLIGKLKGNTDGETILFSAHMDTVSPGVGIKPQIRDGVIYSDGTTVLGGDDKAGIAAILEAIETIKEKDIPHGDIEIVFSIFEEGGLYGAKNLDYSKLDAKLGFVLDSGGDPGQIVVQGPAQNKINAKFIGKEAHAGVAPENGISAIQIASEAISNMNLLRVDEETTANIGLINGGGPTNIVAKEVIFEAEARSLKDEKLKEQTDHMVKCCEEAAKKFGGEVEVEVINAYGAFNVDENHDIVNKVKAACTNIGLEPYTSTTGGGSDTNILNINGITAVNLGIGEKKPHTLEEHLHIKDLENAARLALEIIKEYA